jgi:hypothetical protein
MANFPASPVAFPARVDGQSIFAQHINALQDEVQAIEAALVGGALPSPQRVAGALPEVRVDFTFPDQGHLMKASPAEFDLLFNARYDGANWNLDDTSRGGTLLQMLTTGVNGYILPAGANPRSPVQILGVGAGGIFERARQQPLGDFITAPTTSAWFSASSGTWTPGTIAYYYSLVGRTCFVNAVIGIGSCSATAGLLLTLPFPAASVQQQGTYLVYVNGTWTQALWGITPGATQATLYATAAAGAFPAVASLIVALNLHFAF